MGRTWYRVFFLAVIGVARKRFRLPSDGYRAVKPLSEPEQVLFWRLKEAMPECVVLGQVAFARFIRPQAGDSSLRQGLFNAISRKAVDFLLCLPDFTVVAAVELDDASHAKERDRRRDEIFRSAGIPIVRVRVRDIPSSEALRAMFTR